MRRFAKLAAVVGALLATALLGAGFAGFVEAAHREPSSPPIADGIVVLTGGAERVETGLRLLAADRREAAAGVRRGAAGQGWTGCCTVPALRRARIDARITLGRSAETTAATPRKPRSGCAGTRSGR